jgi:hypothetical protein
MRWWEAGLSVQVLSLVVAAETCTAVHLDQDLMQVHIRPKPGIDRLHLAAFAINLEQINAPPLMS